MEGKKSVVLYVDVITTFEALEDAEAGRLIKHFLRYVNDLNPEPPDKLTQIAFEPIKQQLKRDLVKWEDIKQSKSESGIIGNLKRWHNDLYKKVLKHEINLETALNIAKDRKVSHTDDLRLKTSHTVANIAVNDNVTVNVNVKESNTSDEKSSSENKTHLSKSDLETEKEEKKKGSEKKEKTSDILYAPMIDIYYQFIKLQVGTPPKIDGAEGKAMKSIITYLRQINPDDEQIKIGFKAIFTNFSKWDKFHQSQIKLTQINSNLINIINSIKNGKSNSNNRSEADRIAAISKIIASKSGANSSNPETGKLGAIQ